MPAENAGRAFALVLVDELVRHGMRHAVVAPGSRSTPLALALLENPAVAVHVRVDERSAAYLALGLAATSRAIVPVLCTSGTATSYFLGAVMEADLSRVPLLVLTADRPPELHGIGANQTVEQVGLYGSAVRWALDVPPPAAGPGSVADWRALTSTAVHHLLGGLDGQPPGPVHLNLRLREPLVPTHDGIGFPYDLGLDGPTTQATQTAGPELPDLPAALADRIGAARQGVIVAGGWSAGGVDALLSFAARAGWPIIAEPHSNARRGPMALRSTDALLRDPAFVAAHPPDLVVVVGRVGLSRALLSWLASVPHVVITPDAGPWDVTGTAESVVTCGVEGLAAVAVAPADPDWAQGWLRASQGVSDVIDELLDAASDATLNEPSVARDVAALIPQGGALVVSSSMPIRDLDLVMRPRDGLIVHANRGVSGIDGFVSTAFGVALARDASAGPTIALCGDLSLLHDLNGLMPSGEAPPNLTLVVINNDGGGIFSLLPQGSSVDPEAFERLFGTPHGASLRDLAAGYGVPYQLISTVDELAAALSTYPGLRLLEVRTRRADNTALHARLRAVAPPPG